MAIAVRGSPVSANTASAASLAIDFAGQGMTAGDLAIVFGAMDDSAFDSTWAPETNWKFTRVPSFDSVGAVWYRLCDAGFVSSPSVTFDRSPGTSDQMALAGILLSGVHQTIPVAVREHWQQYFSAPDPFPSPDQLWAPAADCWAVGGLMLGGNIPASGWGPSGYTERIVTNTQGNAQVAIATKALGASPPVSEVPGTWNITSNDFGCSIFLIVVPDTAAFGGGGGGGYPMIGGGLLK